VHIIIIINNLITHRQISFSASTLQTIKAQICQSSSIWEITETA